jgi:hypothetical protein
MKFTLEIELGNEAMQYGHDIAKALEQVGELLKYRDAQDSQSVENWDAYDRKGNVKDHNGNRVGKWAVA